MDQFANVFRCLDSEIVLFTLLMLFLGVIFFAVVVLNPWQLISFPLLLLAVVLLGVSVPVFADEWKDAKESAYNKYIDNLVNSGEWERI